MEPSTTRMEKDDGTARLTAAELPCIHIAGTNGKTSVARMIDALLTAFGPAPAGPPARTCSPRSSGSPSTTNRSARPVTSRPTGRSRPFVQMADAHSVADLGPAMSKFEVLTAMAFGGVRRRAGRHRRRRMRNGRNLGRHQRGRRHRRGVHPIGMDHAEYLGATVGEIAARRPASSGFRAVNRCSSTPSR